MTVRIPPDEALVNAYTKERECLHADRLRAVATLAAEQAVKEAVLWIGSRLMGLPSREYCDVMTVLTTDFPSAFTTIPPKEQQPVTDTLGRTVWTRETGPIPPPSPDPATVRMCIEALREVKGDGSYLPGTERAAALLESLLPKPTPAPEQYVTVEEVADAMKDIGGTLVASRCAVLSRLDKIAAKRGPMLTPEQALEAWREVGDTASASRRGYGETEMLAGFRRAAKQGGAA